MHIIRRPMNVFYIKSNNYSKYCENNDRNDIDKNTLGFGLTYAEFVDLCILCGCDYCGAIKGDDIHLMCICIWIWIYIHL